MDGDAQTPGHPIQRTDFDLSSDPQRTGQKTLSATRSDERSPAAMMRQMGFEPSKKYMTPLQFLVAVMNDDIDLIFKNEKRKKRIEGKGGIALSYRIECAKTASKFMHREMPKVTIQSGDEDKFGEDLARSIEQGTERVRTRRVIIETVERISPDMPLAPASYPPAFVDAIEAETIPAEGDTDYIVDDDDD